MATFFYISNSLRIEWCHQEIWEILSNFHHHEAFIDLKISLLWSFKSK